jgi:hypothetical protein
VILPNFIGIGAPKAGTTWLAKCLGEHPDVFMAAVKETEFWKFADAEQRLAEYAAHSASPFGKDSKPSLSFSRKSGCTLSALTTHRRRVRARRFNRSRPSTV